MALINKLNAVGDAIRAKTGKEGLLTLDDMVKEITAIETGGGGGGDLPQEAFTITGNCIYRFAYNGWNWFIENYGSKVTTKDVTNCQFMFYSADKLETIPFDINCKDNTSVSFNSFLRDCLNLKVTPIVKANPPISASSDYSYIFYRCENLREIPYDFFWGFGSEEYWEKQVTKNNSRNNLFALCKSLRKIPDISMLKNTSGSYSNLYYYVFQYCYSLDEIIDLPVLDGATFTSNVFSSSFNECSRLKNLTFADNEAAVKWKNQTIDLSTYVGYVLYSKYENKILGFNNGITADKEIKDDATYQTLKDDEDAFTYKKEYSRYNHDSAVATIRSLPDTSAYLAAEGGTNTIKFLGESGSATDGGAINTLTEEEIAVATAKGWTVTLV